MKLLFNQSSDIKKHLGFVDVDLIFDNMKPDIITATREVISVISKGVYDLAINQFETGDESDEELEHFLSLVQNPIITRAYALYAPNNDLSHTNDGRKMRNEEHEKNPFQWMIDADNAAQEKRYYRALNDLLIYLNDSSIEAWTSSNEYQKVNKLFVNSLSVFNDYFPLDSLLLLHKLNPGLSHCERREILPRIGKNRFDAIKENPSSEEELVDLVKEACVNFSLAHMIPKLSINILPDGILQSYTSDRISSKGTKPPEFLEKEMATQSFMQAFNQCIYDIEKMIEIPIENENITEISRDFINEKYFTT